MDSPELTADELLLARAEANGYRRGVYRDVDEVRGREKHVTKTKRNQDGTLRRYILWHLGATRQEAAQQCRSPPNEETVRREHLGAGAAAPDLATVKDFLRFYIATSQPRLDADRPTVDSVNIVAEWFFAGFKRVTGTDTDEEERTEVYDWVRRSLTREGIVVNKHRPKHNFTMRDLTRVLLTLWTRDDLIFIPERYCVQTTFIIHVYCWTGARIGAFFTDGLRYKDVVLVLQRVNGRRWRLIYKIDQRWVKNNRDPDNVVFGAAAKESGKLFYNDAGFLLAMAVADNALFGYESLEDVRKQEIPDGDTELVLRFKDSALGQTVLRHCTKTGGVTDEAMPRSAFNNILKSTLTNAGYICGPSIHAIRRQLGKGVDKRHPAVQRSQHLTQADPRVFGQSYVANCSSVDGQAAFRDEETDNRHIEYFQSLEKFHERGLPDKLPMHLEETLQRDPQLCELKEAVQTLIQTAASSDALSKAKKQCTNHLKKLKSKALHQYQEHWVRERRDWKILTRGREVAQDKSKTEFVESICMLIPERGRLAKKMAADEPLEPEEMWRALQDLHTLCIEDLTVLYLPRLRPVDNACPAKCCQLRLDSINLPKPQRNQHTQNCVRWEMASRLERLQSDIHYCYQCFNWVVGEEWEPHCQSHPANMATRRCGTITYCHTLVRPGYCPFCMSDSALPASARLESWTRDHKLWSHVNGHLGQCHWPRACPHPLCDTSVTDAVALQFHFMDEHGFSRARPGKSADSLLFDSQDKNISLDDKDQATLPNRKRKPSGGTTNVEWMSPLSVHDIPVTAAALSHSYLQKRPRLMPPAICPTIWIADGAVSDGRSTSDMVESVTLSSHYSQSIEELTNREYSVLPSDCSTPHDATDPIKPEDSGGSKLFDEYLRSPSPSPPPLGSPDGACSLSSGSTLVDTGRGSSEIGTTPHTGPIESPASKVVAENGVPGQDGEDLACVSTGSHIRLRVSRPKIMLRLKLQDTEPHGKKERKGKKTRKTTGPNRQRKRVGTI